MESDDLLEFLVKKQNNILQVIDNISKNLKKSNSILQIYYEESYNPKYLRTIKRLSFKYSANRPNFYYFCLENKIIKRRYFARRYIKKSIKQFKEFNFNDLMKEINKLENIDKDIFINISKLMIKNYIEKK